RQQNHGSLEFNGPRKGLNDFRVSQRNPQGILAWRDNFNEHRFGVGAPAPGNPDAAQPARDNQKRRVERVSSLVQTKPALANDRWAVGQTNLAAMRVP